MKYDEHVDAAVMPMGNGIVRADFSYTVFLSSPEDYEGGELLIKNNDGEDVRVKPPAGSLFLYTSGKRHQVLEVTEGCRSVAVGWMQSVIPDSEHREIVCNLESVMANLLVKNGKDADYDKINTIAVNLKRMWARV
jgi:PKHD-type hydroxylase